MRLPLQPTDARLSAVANISEAAGDCPRSGVASNESSVAAELTKPPPLILISIARLDRTALLLSGLAMEAAAMGKARRRREKRQGLPPEENAQ